MGSLAEQERPARHKEEGLQPCNLVIGARDDSIAGDPCCCSLCVRRRRSRSLAPARRARSPIRADRARGRAGRRPGMCSDRQFLGWSGGCCPAGFRELPDQSQYNRRLRRLTPAITTVQLMVAELIADGRGALGRRHADRLRQLPRLRVDAASSPGTPATATARPRACSCGACAWSDLRRKGVPVGYDLVGPKTGQERERALRAAAAHPGAVLFADKGFWGREYQRSMELIDIQLVTPDRHRLGKRPPARSPRPASAW